MLQPHSTSLAVANTIQYNTLATVTSRHVTSRKRASSHLICASFYFIPLISHRIAVMDRPAQSSPVQSDGASRIPHPRPRLAIKTRQGRASQGKAVQSSRKRRGLASCGVTGAPSVRGSFRTLRIISSIPQCNAMQCTASAVRATVSQSSPSSTPRKSNQIEYAHRI